MRESFVMTSAYPCTKNLWGRGEGSEGGGRSEGILGTAQGINQNASFHPGPVQPFNNSLFCFFLLVAAWFDKPEVDLQFKMLKGDSVSFTCGARGFPLEVEWKVNKESEDKVQSCISKCAQSFVLCPQKGSHSNRCLTLVSVDCTCIIGLNTCKSITCIS